jgi:thiamine-phosphate pyrophosphorylase
VDPVAGESRLSPRLFLVAPELPAATLADCLAAACAVGDVASLVVPPALAKEIAPLAQAKSVAVLTTGDLRNAAPLGCDGIHVDAAEASVADARAAIGKDRIVGAFAGASRHVAMEAAEAGADYIAFAQNRPTPGGEPILGWWSELFEIPCVAFDPVEPGGLDILLPQNPDFIRPSDAMWDSPAESHRIVAALMQRLAP